MQQQILTIGRLLIALIGTLGILDTDLIAFLPEALEKAVGAIFVLVEIVGLITDKLRTDIGANSVPNLSTFAAKLLLLK